MQRGEGLYTGYVCCPFQLWLCMLHNEICSNQIRTQTLWNSNRILYRFLFLKKMVSYHIHIQTKQKFRKSLRKRDMRFSETKTKHWQWVFFPVLFSAPDLIILLNLSIILKGLFLFFRKYLFIYAFPFLFVQVLDTCTCIRKVQSL